MRLDRSAWRHVHIEEPAARGHRGDRNVPAEPGDGGTAEHSGFHRVSADVGYHVTRNNDDENGTSWDEDYFYDFSLTYGLPGDPDVASISVSRSLQPQSSAQLVTQTGQCVAIAGQQDTAGGAISNLRPSERGRSGPEPKRIGRDPIAATCVRCSARVTRRSD